MDNPLNQPNEVHEKNFAEDGSKTPLAHQDQALNLTVASQKGSFKQGASNVPPGGRPMIAGMKPTSQGVRDQWAREFGRVGSPRQVQGRVETKSNHPNKKLNNIYG